MIQRHIDHRVEEESIHDHVINARFAIFCCILETNSALRQPGTISDKDQKYMQRHE